MPASDGKKPTKRRESVPATSPKAETHQGATEGLTDLQRRFVEEYVANGFKDAKNAALRAGYAGSFADNAYKMVTGSPSVRSAINEAKDAFQEECRDELVGAAQGAIRALRAVIDDVVAPHSAKVTAAKAIIEMSGVGAPAKIDLSGEMTVRGDPKPLTREEAQLLERIAGGEE